MKYYEVQKKEKIDYPQNWRCTYTFDTLLDAYRMAITLIDFIEENCPEICKEKIRNSIRVGVFSIHSYEYYYFVDRYNAE